MGVPQSVMNDQKNHHEPPQGRVESELDEETRAWIEELENAPRPEPHAPRTAEELLEGAKQAEAGWLNRLKTEPYLTWGNNSTTVQRELRRLDPRQTDQVKWLGEQVETEFCFQPPWSDKIQIKKWVRGLIECVKASRGDPALAVEAGWKLIHNERTVADPWSLIRTTGALAAEREREKTHGGHQPDSTSPRWTDEDIEAANVQAAADLGE
jgi:hypothetical protein